MPNPSRFGFGRHAVNISCPEWIHKALDEVRREEDYRSVAETALELVVKELLKRGYEVPDELDLPDFMLRDKARKPPKR